MEEVDQYIAMSDDQRHQCRGPNHAYLAGSATPPRTGVLRRTGRWLTHYALWARSVAPPSRNVPMSEGAHKRPLTVLPPTLHSPDLTSHDSSGREITYSDALLTRILLLTHTGSVHVSAASAGAERAEAILRRRHEALEAGGRG